MTMFGTEFLIVALACVIACSCIGLVFYLMRVFGTLRGKVEALTVLVKEGDKHREALAREVQELRSGIIGVGRRVMEFDKKLQSQDARLDEVGTGQQDPQSRLYSRAMKMVELGAGIEELVAECELPRAEAELLIRLHRKPA